MIDYSEGDREHLARDIGQELRTLAPADVEGGQYITRLLAQDGITESMAEDRNLTVGTHRERIEYALARALAYLKSVEGRVGAVYDQETLNWHTMVLAHAATPVPQVCMCGRPARECSDRRRTGQPIEPYERLEKTLPAARGAG
ncbi:hypothetical protein [Streptomyces sp. NPDC050485]|uniref:hypothetical protein n=1 Tax=Streptomyces sp. NPDC050485 TaxID=3365617 RepID=UPI003787ABCB